MKRRAKQLTQTSEVGSDDFDNIISSCRFTTGFDNPVDKTGKTNKVPEDIPNQNALQDDLPPSLEPPEPPSQDYNDAEKLAAIIELAEILKESNSKIEAHQQRYKLNIESILFSEESPIVRDLKMEIAKSIEINLEMMPTILNGFIGDNYRKTKKYPISSIEDNSTDLVLPDSGIGNYERWADRDKTKGETVFQFFDRVWGKYVNAGLLFQTDLRGEQGGESPKKGLDKRLYDLLLIECQKEKMELKYILPNKSHKTTKKIIKKINKLLAA